MIRRLCCTTTTSKTNISARKTTKTSNESTTTEYFRIRRTDIIATAPMKSSYYFGLLFKRPPSPPACQLTLMHPLIKEKDERHVQEMYAKNKFQMGSIVKVAVDGKKTFGKLLFISNGNDCTVEIERNPKKVVEVIHSRNISFGCTQSDDFLLSTSLAVNVTDSMRYMWPFPSLEVFFMPNYHHVLLTPHKVFTVSDLLVPLHYPNNNDMNLNEENEQQRSVGGVFSAFSICIDNRVVPIWIDPASVRDEAANKNGQKADESGEIIIHRVKRRLVILCVVAFVLALIWPIWVATCCAIMMALQSSSNTKL
jgi:hypothetical protein